MTTPLPTTDTSTATVPQEVPINMWCTDEAVVVVAAMPGVRAEDVTVRNRDGVLELRADLRTPAPKDYVVHEWDYGNYLRVVRLPDGFSGTLRASFGNGQLAVRVGRTGSRSANGVPVTPTGVLDQPRVD